MVSFFFKRLNEASIFIGTSVNLLLITMDSLCCGKATLTPVLPIESPAKRVSIGEEKSICKGAFHFQWNAEFAKRTSTKWWAKMDSNHRPHDYQSCALASWALGPFWWRLAGSNRWPPACKAGALPAELNPQIFTHLLTRCIHCQLSTVNCQFSLCPLNWITLST